MNEANGDGDVLGLIWNTILTVALFLLGLYSAAQREDKKQMRDEIEQANKKADELERSLARHRLFAAETFATKSDVSRGFDKIETKLDRLDEKIDDRLPPPPQKH